MSWLDVKALKEKHDKLITNSEEIFSFAKSENRKLTAEESAQVDKIHEEAFSVASEVERLEKQESLKKETFNLIKEVEKKPEAFELCKKLHTFGLTSGTSNSGAELMNVLVPDFLNQVLRSAAPVWTMGFRVANVPFGGAYNVPTSTATNNSAIVAEGSSITPANQTTDKKSCQDYAYSAITKVTEQALRDSIVNLEDWIRQDFIDDVGNKFSIDATVGNGSGKPEGFVTASALGKTAAATAAITLDEVYDLIYSIDPIYHSTCKLSMHASTWNSLVQLKDDNNRHLLQNGNYGNGTVRSIENIPVVLNNSMDTLAAAKKVVCMTSVKFGLIKIVDGAFNMKILNELYQGSNEIGFKTMSSLGFCHTNTAANKHLITAAS